MSYNRQLVEHLIPAIWDQDAAYGMANPYAPDKDMPKGHADKKAGSPLSAHLADIRNAWKRADVPQVQRQAVLLSFGLGWTQREIAAYQQVRQATVCARIDAGVGRLTAWLNKEKFCDGYDGDPDADLGV